MKATAKQRKEWEKVRATHEPLFLHLHPELQKTAYNDGGLTYPHGPLLLLPFLQLKSMAEVEEINAAYLKKRARGREYIKEFRFADYLFLVERPYRLNAFLKLRSKLTDRLYWTLLSEVWTDAEHPSRDPKLTKRYIRLFECKRKYRSFLMNPDERRILSTLPHEMTIYRGGMTPFGLSWSLEREKAEFFVGRNEDRSGENGTVFVGKVKKEHVFAYLDGREEKEIVVNPKHVHEIATP